MRDHAPDTPYMLMNARCMFSVRQAAAWFARAVFVRTAYSRGVEEGMQMPRSVRAEARLI